MAVPTWSQLTFLTGPQQTQAAAYATLGNAIALWRSGKGPKPDISAFSYQSSKTADGLLRDLATLTGPAKMGIEYVYKIRRQENLDALDAANP
jgi:hypothetical protein